MTNPQLTEQAAPLRPLEHPGLARRIWPFAICTLIALAAALIVRPGGDPVGLIAAVALFAAIAATIVAVPWSRFRAGAQTLPPLFFVAAVAFLRHDTGGSDSAFSALMALPVAWFTLYGTAYEIGVCVVVVAVGLGAPVALIGGPDYPSADLLRTLVLTVVAGTLGFSVNKLVRLQREREEETSSILEAAHESFISVDGEGLIRRWNRQAERDFGYTADEALGREAAELVVPAVVRSEFRGEIVRAVQTGRSPILGRRIEVRGLRRDNSEFPLEMTISTVETAAGLQFHAFLHDISERRDAEFNLQQAEERFRRAFDDAAIGMALTSPEGRWLRVNRALAEMLGKSVADLTGFSFREITHPEDRDRDTAALSALVVGEIDRYQAEKRYFHADGSVIWVNLNVSVVRDPAGKMLYVIAQMQDVTERREAQKRLAHEASHDPLTGLPNRALLDDRMGMALARLRRSELPLAVLFLDLDRFKLVNDSLGHEAGDRLLVEVAERLGRLLRPSDTVARLGGDEFAILCEDITPDATATLAGRIGESLARDFNLDGHTLSVTTSIGIAIDRDPDVSPGTLLANADAAMYEAKTRGRSRYAFFATEMRTRASGRLEAEAELREAIEAGQIEAHFQPQVDLSEGRVIGIEALARWRHPEHGLMSASDFIPIAEESDLIVAIGDRVLEASVAHALAWHKRGGNRLRVTVNLSARQLTGPEISGTVANLLDRSGFPPELLCLEMTDRTFAEDLEGALEAMSDLRDLGVTLAIDEFGVGTSNLGLLRGMPEIGVLKIDPSFIRGIDGGRAARELVVAVIHMAHALDMEVVAEGVETATEAGLLRELGCDAAQGNHIGRPVPAAELDERILGVGQGRP